MNRIRQAFYLARRFVWACKYLVAVRQALPLPARVMAALALPFTLMPGVPDFGIDEILWTLTGIVLWFTRRELLRAVWAESGQPWVPF